MMQYADYEIIVITRLARPFRAQMVFLPQPRPVALSLPTSLTGMDELCLWCNRLNVNGLRCSVKPPFQGLGGLPCQDPGRWPGLWLKRAVGAEANRLYSAYS